jgi:hypothetical protein
VGQREVVVCEIGAPIKAWLRAVPEHCILLDPAA